MKLLGILRFEARSQARRAWPWLAFAALTAFAFFNTRVGIVPVTLPEDFILNSPFIITSVTVIGTMIWVLVAPAIAGEAAAGDVRTGMHPLLYASPIGKAEYLGGKFLAALLLNALVLLGVQVGSLLAVHAPGVDPAIVAPFRAGPYVRAYALVALPNALIGTALQFAVAQASGRVMAAYLGSLLLLFLSYPVSIAISFPLRMPWLGSLTDPLGVLAIMNAMMLQWTIVEKNVRPFSLEGVMLWNRLLWAAVALATLALTHARFRFAHRSAVTVDLTRWWRRGRRGPAGAVPADAAAPRAAAAAARAEHPHPAPTHDGATHRRQVRAIAGASFAALARTPAGLFVLLGLPAFLLLIVLVESQHWGVPLVPQTDQLLSRYLTARIAAPENFWAVVPLLIIYFAGELVWRERDAGLGETTDATAVPDWVLLAGKYLGLAALLVAMLLAVTASGMLAQSIIGHADHRPGLALFVQLGLHLPEYLIFAAFAFAVQVIVDQKHVAMFAGLVAYVANAMAPLFGVGHGLLVLAGGPHWSYTTMRGFGPTLAPWAWFKLYWAAAALLLLVAARLAWVRGREPGRAARWARARARVSPAVLGTAAVAATLLVGSGGWVLYNTHVRHPYLGDATVVERRAEYERRYARFADAPQPALASTVVRVEIEPARGAARATGRYRLVNRTAVPIDSVHVAPAPGADTRIAFDRPATRVLADGTLWHEIHALARPLAPGDTLTLEFDVALAPRGFRAGGASLAVTRGATYLTGAMLPALGYQPQRELTGASERRARGLPRKLTFASPEDVAPDLAAARGAPFEATIVTDTGQVAVAPGTLRREWTEGGRRHFTYASDEPVGGLHTIASARYDVIADRWEGVELRVFHHPAHRANAERVARAARAALAYYAATFGPYPHRFLHVVELPGRAFGMGVDGSGVVTGYEGIFLLDPPSEAFTVSYEVTAHEVAHLWWGGQLQYANAEGAILLSESLAWYSGLRLVQHEKGREALRQFMYRLREPNPWPPIRTGLPLLRAMDPYAGYRRGPFALYALSEYAGDTAVNGALRRLLRAKAGPSPTRATTLDLYRELQAATPDSLRPLLADLFERNTYWSFDTKAASARQVADGAWEVTFDLEAEKTVVDSAGRATEVPMAEWVELGVFAAAGPGEVLGRPLHLQRHRLRSGRQSITVRVTDRPARGGVDPYNLLDWEEGDNIEPIDVP